MNSAKTLSIIWQVLVILISLAGILLMFQYHGKVFSVLETKFEMNLGGLEILIGLIVLNLSIFLWKFLNYPMGRLLFVAVVVSFLYVLRWSTT